MPNEPHPIHHLSQPRKRKFILYYQVGAMTGPSKQRKIAIVGSRSVGELRLFTSPFLQSPRSRSLTLDKGNPRSQCSSWTVISSKVTTPPSRIRSARSSSTRGKNTLLRSLILLGRYVEIFPGGRITWSGCFELEGKADKHGAG